MSAEKDTGNVSSNPYYLTLLLMKMRAFLFTALLGSGLLFTACGGNHEETTTPPNDTTVVVTTPAPTDTIQVADTTGR